MDEETMEDELEERKGKILKLIPASGRYYKYRVEAEESIDGATSLKLLSDAIDAYLSDIRPNDNSKGDHTSPAHSETAPISAFNIIQRNLLKEKSEIDELRRVVVIREDDEER
ncbi:hypothetical protein KI440_01825 [Candidatus Saccharibacteria bacterium TM7i]|nr:hypothetical protein KI440_01825 [Candidatus Saccharibacteria bacterium TM7i]